MIHVAEWVVSLVVIVGAMAFVLFCLLGFGRGLWLFVCTGWPRMRTRGARRGFEVLPVKRAGGRVK